MHERGRDIVWMTAMTIGLWLTARPGAAGAAAPGALAGEQFFEARIRPLLVERCQSCHGSKKQEAGLRLDSAGGLAKGSENGPVIVSGDPDNSPLIAAVRYGGTIEMPPDGRLADAEIDDLVAWTRSGAVWPASDAGVPAEVDRAAAAKSHWSFQALHQPAVPRLLHPEWAATPVDAFIAQRLEQAGLNPGAPADRRTLIRRATLDLLGIPPAPAEVEAFEADPAPDAFSRVVERLLASPRYGERWGRFWLDVARYGDTKGYVRLSENPNYTCSWTYRDYVIRAFNEDLPYDRFILEQLAADRLDLGDDPRPLAAMGFLTLGQRFINSQPDIIDDRIDVVTRGLMGLTVTCARCHDHKFDPIPTQDYYALYGVFASSLEPRVPPLVLRPEDRGPFRAYLEELGQRTATLDAFLEGQRDYLMEGFRSRIAEYLLVAQGEEVQPNFLAVMFLVDANRDLNPVMVQRWARFLELTRKQPHPVLAPWNDLALLAPRKNSLTPAETEKSPRPNEIAAAWPQRLAQWRSALQGPERLNQTVVEALAAAQPRDLDEAANCYGQLFQQADERWRAALEADPQARGLPDAEWEEIRQLLYGADSPINFSIAELDEFLFVDATKQQMLQGQQKRIEDWISSPGAAPHAMTLIDAFQPADTPIFVRGNPSKPGPLAPRQFLSALSPGAPRPLTDGSGRLDLARAIASPDNPLTARVLVNRVWMHHFGTGLVATPGDFGMRGDLPSHPELLDFLASTLVASGWSIKDLHRDIMLSDAYQRASRLDDIPTAALEQDPDNRLLWRMTRRRLDWEPFRDSLLSVCGRLDGAMEGPSVDLFQESAPPRRSVYGVVDRQNLPGTLRSFDFPSPDATSAQRHATTVPQQALFLLNSRFLEVCARDLAARPDVAGISDPGQRIDRVTRLLFGRAATPEERSAVEEYLAAAGGAPAAQFLSPWEEVLQAMLMSNEFLFVD